MTIQHGITCERLPSITRLDTTLLVLIGYVFSTVEDCLAPHRLNTTSECNEQSTTAMYSSEPSEMCRTRHGIPDPMRQVCMTSATMSTFPRYATSIHRTAHSPQSRTFTPKQGMRTCRFSTTLRRTSKAFSFTPAMIPLDPPVDLLLMLSSARLASEPPVPFTAAIAKLAVSLSSSVTVELPPNKELAVSVILLVEGCHRGSNQSAWKSKSENTKTNKRMEQ